MAEMSYDCRVVTMSKIEAAILEFLRKQLPAAARDQWLQMALESGDKDTALFLLLAAL